MNKRVDYETARALMLLGMPQGFVINDKYKTIRRAILCNYVSRKHVA